MKLVWMRDTSPLILVQFLKDSMLEALMARVLIRVPTPTPSQAAGRQRLCQVVCLSALSLSLSTCLSAALSTFRTGSLTGFAALDSVVVHLERSGAAGANTRPTCHHIVIYIQTTREHNLVSFYQKIRKNLKYLFYYLF